MLYGFTLLRKTIHPHQDKELRTKRAGWEAAEKGCPDAGDQKELPLSTGDWAGPGSEETF